MKKVLAILAGSIILLLLFLGLLRIKNMEEGYEGGHGGGGGSHMGGGGSHMGGGHMGGEGHGGGGHHEGPHIGYAHPSYNTRSYDHSSYYGYYPVYSSYEYPVYYVSDNDDYIFDENGILYYIYNPHLLWNKLFGLA